MKQEPTAGQIKICDESRQIDQPHGGRAEG